MVFSVGLLAYLIALGIDLFFDKYAIPNQRHFSNVRKVDRLISNTNPAEIPIFGSSVARRGYFCDSIGPNVYNYGMAGSLFNAIYPLLQIELDKDKTSPIIMDFDHHTFLYSELIQLDLSNYIPHIDNPYIKTMLVEHGKYDWSYEVPGTRYFGLYMDYSRDFLKPKFEKEEYINCGGVFYPARDKVFQRFLIKREEMLKQKRELREKKANNPTLFNLSDSKRLGFLEALFNFHPDSTNVARFEALMADHRDRQFILVYSPQNWSKLEGLENYEEVVDFIEGIEERNPNLKLFNYSQVVFPDAYYRDSGHMNILGAKAFSSMLGKDIKPYL